MDQVREIMMKVDGMTCEGCAETVRRTIEKLDPEAHVHIDLGRGQVTARTRADTLEVTDAITKAGYNATGMMGG
jgi:copper chaperone